MDKRLNQTGRVMYRESIHVGCQARDCVSFNINPWKSLSCLAVLLFFCSFRKKTVVIHGFVWKHIDYKGLSSLRLLSCYAQPTKRKEELLVE